MSQNVYEPIWPESKSYKVYRDKFPDIVTAFSEWTYTDQAKNEFRLTKPVPSIYKKNAPANWFERGWIQEKSDVQLILF